MASTTARAQELAARLKAVNDDIIATVEGAGDAEWQRQSPSEGWSVGVLAHHCAQVQGFFTEVIAGSKAGEQSPTTLSQEVIDESNARHAHDFANVGTTETLEALRTNGAEAVRQIGGLTDENLDQAAVVIGGQELTWAQVVEFALINHFSEHLASMRATIAG